MENLESQIKSKILFGAEHAYIEQIAKLRVAAHQADGYITLNTHPQGWKDELDKTAYHFIVLEKDKVIAAARFNVFRNLSQHEFRLAFEKICNTELFKNVGYFSRSCVDPEYRGLGLSKKTVIWRESFASHLGIQHVFSVVAGFQIDNFKKRNFEVLGQLDLSLIAWKAKPAVNFLMYKYLRLNTVLQYLPLHKKKRLG